MSVVSELTVGQFEFAEEVMGNPSVDRVSEAGFSHVFYVLISSLISLLCLCLSVVLILPGGVGIGCYVLKGYLSQELRFMPWVLTWLARVSTSCYLLLLYLVKVLRMCWLWILAVFKGVRFMTKDFEFFERVIRANLNVRLNRGDLILDWLVLVATLFKCLQCVT